MKLADDDQIADRRIVRLKPLPVEDGRRSLSTRLSALMSVQRKLLGFALTLVLCTSSQADTSSTADSTKNFFVASVFTALHRATVSSSADTYAIVNCNSLIVNGDLDLSALDEDDFIAALTNATPDLGHLLLVCRYKLDDVTDNARLRKRLNNRLKELSETAGYQKLSLSETKTSVGWADAYDRANEFIQPDEASEPLIENNHVQVFPVRTRLSKLVHGETDCIVEVIRPIDGRTNEISSDLSTSIRNAIEGIQLPQKHLLLFRLSSTESGREKVQDLFDVRPAPKIPDTKNPVLLKLYETQAEEYKPSPALALAQDLGFHRILYSHSSGGGAPEELVGAKAPNFELTQLDGTPLILHDFIRDRPALITFWGLACGPCRTEAPYLSALHEKHGQAFSIVAVNGYNDDGDAVAEYVKSEKLSHPIVLQGRAVSDELYRVGAYPTTFWVDRNGVIIDYDIGFTSGRHLEERLEKVLKR